MHLDINLLDITKGHGKKKKGRMGDIREWGKSTAEHACVQDENHINLN